VGRRRDLLRAPHSGTISEELPAVKKMVGRLMESLPDGTDFGVVFYNVTSLPFPKEKQAARVVLVQS
jgi:hypothetical protein